MSELNNDQAIIAQEEQVLEKMPIDHEKVNAIATTININDPTAFLAYGSKPMAEIAKFSDTLLSRIKTKDAGEVGGQLSDLVLKIREYDPFTLEEKSSGFLTSLPVIGGLFRRAEKSKIDHTTLTSQVDIIASHLDNSMVGLLRDNEQLAQLYDKNLDYYRFNGSLTTPPCTEGVRWVVLKDIQQASNQQIQAFSSLMGHANNRPIQAQNARLILE